MSTVILAEKPSQAQAYAESFPVINVKTDFISYQVMDLMKLLLPMVLVI